MKANLRASIASIAAQLAGNDSSPAIYDYTQGNYVSFDGSVSKSTINISDRNDTVHLVGVLPNLHEERSGAFLTLQVDGTQFQGFDFESQKHFMGSLDGGLVTIFDCESGQHHHFNV